jgi:hypothetical protein
MLPPHLARGYSIYPKLLAPHIPLQLTVSLTFKIVATEHTCSFVEDQAGIGTRADRLFVLATCLLLVPFIYKFVHHDVHK